MTGPIVLTDETIRRMEEEASRRLGMPVIRLKEAIEKITIEELIVRGIVASLKEVKAMR